MEPSLSYMSPKNNNQGVLELFKRSNCTQTKEKEIKSILNGANVVLTVIIHTYIYKI